MPLRVPSVFVLVAAGCLLASCGSESTDPSTVSPEEVVAATAIEPSFEITTVEGAIAAANAGDYEDWISHFAAEALIPLNTLANVSVEDHFRFETAIGTTRTLAEPCKLIGNSVECNLAVESDLYTPAGLAPTLTSAFFFDSGGKIITVNEQFATDLINFWEGYLGWLKDAHADVFDQIMEAEATAYILMTPATAALVLAHVEEFVAQSEDYPKR